MKELTFTLFLVSLVNCIQNSVDNYKIDGLVNPGYLGCNKKCGKPKIYMVMMQQGDDMKEERFMCLTLERKNFAGITPAKLIFEGVGNLGPH